VALDSGFVQGWAQLARAQAVLYFSSAPSPAVAEAAHQAAQRALVLAPARPEGHQALGPYYYYVIKDSRRAYTEDSTALALTPSNAEVLGALGFDELSLGRWEAARRHLEQAVGLDPRSSLAATNLGYVLLLTRRYSEAAKAHDRALELEPANLYTRENAAMVALAQGDLARAQAIIKATPKTVAPTALAAYVAVYWDLIWVLDDAQQQLLLRLSPAAFDNNREVWGIVRGQTYALRGDMANARVYADSTRLAVEPLLRVSPQDGVRHAVLGLALAYLGQKAAAIREGQRAVALLPISRDALQGAYIQHQLLRIYILAAEPEKALDQLEPLLKIPNYLSPGWLKIDPSFAPLRGNPRFERLVNGS